MTLPLSSGLRIGMFGMWGMNVPGRQFAGFESAFSEIAPRLVVAGHDVVIYSRRSEYPPGTAIPSHQGVRLVYLPSWGGKNFSGLLNTLLAVVHALATARLDVLFFVNVGMGFHCALAKLSGKPVVLNVDGLDWRRGKWGPIGRAYFFMAAKVAVRVCDVIVTDAEAMRAFYRERFGRDSDMIAYGAHVADSEEPALLSRFGVEPRSFYLIVSRLIPENTLDVMLEAFVASRSTRRLVVVGSANYDSPFHRRLKDVADDRVVFTGHIHDQRELRELWTNCYAYLHGHSVGGTNPALLQALGYGSCVLALDTEFNREVLGSTGLLFPRHAGALTGMIDALDADPARADSYRQRGPARIRERYTWERIARQYDELFRSVAARARRANRPDDAAQAAPRSAA